MNRVQKALERTSDTRALEIGSGILPHVGKMFKDLFPGQKALIVADTNTYEVAGRTVHQLLEEAGIVQEEPYIFDDPDLHAEWRFVERLDGHLKQTDAIVVAVGSGTINDLSKLCSYHQGRRYMCVATAASMDGYAAYGASVIFEGNKQTFECPAPLGILADTAVIAGAPSEMTAAGYADLFAKVPAGADWILADELGVEPIDTFAFSIVQDGLKDALADPEGVRSGDEKKIEALIEGLMLGGFAMQASRTSRPASGADHQFSHLWDMEHHTFHGHAPSHGFKVSIGMLASLALYDQLLATDIPHLDVEACVKAWPTAEESDRVALELYAGSDFPELGLRETRAKYIPKDQLRDQLNVLKTHWPRLKERLQAQLVPFSEAKRRLDLVGAPTDPSQIGIGRERLHMDFIKAQHIRRRFTILDVAVRICMLDHWVDVILSPEGVWPPLK